MKRTPRGTSVGVDDPYEYVKRCDYLTSDGRCRCAIEQPERYPEFACERQREEYVCLASENGVEWSDCPHFRAQTSEHECRRCGLEERRMAHSGERPLLEEHHLSYHGRRDENSGEDPTHEITVSLCRWCHAKIHRSWARIDDEVSPDPEALAEAEGRRSRELGESEFRTANERYDQ
jgi:hypothetical protein